MKIRALPLTAVLAVTALLGGCAAGDRAERSADAVEGVEHIVAVAGMTFEPAELTIAVGDTVTWVFDDVGRPHDIVAVDRSFQSGLLETGEYSFTFTGAGVYDYFCTPHPGMEGVVTVAD